MKKEKKEQLNIYLWDLESAVESWISKLKKEQDKLFAMIEENGKEEAIYRDMWFGRKEKTENWLIEYSNNSKAFEILQIAETYYKQLFQNVCQYINIKIYELIALFCQNKKDLSDFLSIVSYQKMNENIFSFYVNLDKKHIKIESTLFNIYPSRTSCLFVEESFHLYFSGLKEQLINVNWRDNKLEFNALNEDDVLKLNDYLCTKKTEVINKINKVVENDFLLNIDSVIGNIMKIKDLKEQQKKELEQFVNKQKSELEIEDCLNIAFCIE